MFDDLLGKEQEKVSKYDEEQAEAYAESVNDRYRKLRQSSARFKFNVGNIVVNSGQSVSGQGDIDDIDLDEADELAENIKKAIEQIMRQHGRPDTEIEREKKRVDREFKKMKGISDCDYDDGCETCGGDCNEGQCDDPWGNMTGCLDCNMKCLDGYCNITENNAPCTKEK